MAVFFAQRQSSADPHRRVDDDSREIDAAVRDPLQREVRRGWPATRRNAC